MDRATIQQVAALAKLRLSSDEVERLSQQIAGLLAHFATLQEVDTRGVEPCPYPMPIPHRLRPDAPGPCLSQDEVLAGAPDARAGCFRVPRTVPG